MQAYGIGADKPGHRHDRRPPAFFWRGGDNMALEQLVKMVVDNGLSVACVVYLMWYQSNVMQKTIETLNEITNRLTAIEAKLEEHQHVN